MNVESSMDFDSLTDEQRDEIAKELLPKFWRERYQANKSNSMVQLALRNVWDEYRSVKNGRDKEDWF